MAQPENILEYEPTWSDYFGKEVLSDAVLLPFEEAREFVLKLNLKNQKEWQKYCKSGVRPWNIPTAPNNKYKDKGWITWGDWLGTGTISTQDIVSLPFEEAHKFVLKLNLKNKKEWQKYCKSGNRPNNIPANPQRSYKDKGWITWQIG